MNVPGLRSMGAGISMEMKFEYELGLHGDCETAVRLDRMFDSICMRRQSPGAPPLRPARKCSRWPNLK